MRLFHIVASVALIANGVIAPTPLRAWGEFGHLTVCDLAYRNFTPTTRAAVRDLLQVQTGGITIAGAGDQDDRRYTSFNVGCLEEDSQPRRHPKDHFINVSRDTLAIEGNTCPLSATTSQPMQCILAGIDRDLAILHDASKPRRDRVIALMALGHWVGDIHQPLHVSFKDDAGGNSVNIRFSGKCGTSTYRPGNLHAVWDNCLLQAGLFEKVRQRADFKTSWGERTITYRAVDSLVANTPLANEQAYVRTSPWQWAAESYVITRSPEVRYCTLLGTMCQYSETQTALGKNDTPRSQKIDVAYQNAFKGVAEDRVKKAGFRLAHLINRALDPAYVGPT